MIVRDHGDGTWTLLRQHDHGLSAGLIAAAWTRRVIPDDDVVFAVAHHDIGWVGLDATVHRSPVTGVPYSFIDHPDAPKYAAYRAGLDLLETAGPVVGWLCSAHFARFVESLDDPVSAAFLAAEQARQERLWPAIAAGRQAVIHDELSVLRTCDALSLFFCLNDPGSSTWPWYRDGVAFGDERLDVRWDGPDRVVIDPDPLARPVDVTVPWRRIDAHDRTVTEGVLSVTLGGTGAGTR
ncbi:MAG: DUF3891 family protein [Actinobacteria bacterium]|nr:DUF3891 family protein [Actinomycetota bacterium]